MMFRSDFGPLLGLMLEVFCEPKWRQAKAIKKPSQKTLNKPKMMPKMNSNWSQRGSQIGAKIIKNEVLEAPCFKCGPSCLQSPSVIDFGEVLGPCWDHFCEFLLAYVWSVSHALFSNVLHTKTFKITRSHQKNAAQSFQETASLFVPSCIGKFTSEC